MASCPVVPAYRIFQACNNCGAVDGSGCMDQILWVTLFMKNHTHNRNLNTRTDLEFSGKFAQKVPTNLGDQTAVLGSELLSHDQRSWRSHDTPCFIAV
eukprot:672262_1